MEKRVESDGVVKVYVEVEEEELDRTDVSVHLTTVSHS